MDKFHSFLNKPKLNHIVREILLSLVYDAISIKEEGSDGKESVTFGIFLSFLKLFPNFCVYYNTNSN